MSELSTNSNQTAAPVVHGVVMPKFGDSVSVNIILERSHKVKIRNGSKGGTFRAQCKFWREKAIATRVGILIGYRNLSNGTREWEGDVGYIYSPDEHFRAALVVFSERENPVYVPLSGLA